MKTVRISLKTTEVRGVRLDEFLMQNIHREISRTTKIEPLSKSKIRRLIMAGAVHLDNRPVRIPSLMLVRGSSITVVVDVDRLCHEKNCNDIAFELSADRILYEDQYLIVVNKPAGLPTEGTVVESRDHLCAAVKRYIEKRDGVPDQYIGLHHRLDRETSGVILFSKDRTVNRGLHDIFLNHTAQKTYLAICHRPDDNNMKSLHREFIIENCLSRISIMSSRAKWGSVKDGGEPAITNISILEENRFYLLVKAVPFTGRTHQIRVHLSEYGLPILGDTLYGGESSLKNVPFLRAMLHAESLVFPHPITNRKITVRAALPGDFKLAIKSLNSL